MANTFIHVFQKIGARQPITDDDMQLLNSFLDTDCEKKYIHKFDFSTITSDNKILHHCIHYRVMKAKCV